MAKPKAKAAPVEIPASYEAANALLAEVGALQRDLAKEEARLADKVAKLTALIEHRAGPLKERLKSAEAQVQAYADANRDALLKDERKSHDMPAGRIGWRANPPSVEIKSGLRVADVAKSIIGLGLRRKFLRLAYALDKEAMLKDEEKAETVPGVTIRRGETFFIEPKGATLSPGAP